MRSHSGVDSITRYANQVRELQHSKSQHLQQARDSYKKHFQELNLKLGAHGMQEVQAQTAFSY
jgi:hypothetical protein